MRLVHDAVYEPFVCKDSSVLLARVPLVGKDKRPFGNAGFVDNSFEFCDIGSAGRGDVSSQDKPFLSVNGYVALIPVISPLAFFNPVCVGVVGIGYYTEAGVSDFSSLRSSGMISVTFLGLREDSMMVASTTAPLFTIRPLDSI